MKRIYLIGLVILLSACGSETDTSLGMLNEPPSISIKEHEPYRYKVVLNNASEDAVVSINNLPNWAEFDTEENTILGVPGHENADSEFTYSISAVDGGNVFQSSDVTISVTHSELRIFPLPRPRTTLTELSSYSQDVDVESDLAQLTYSLLNAPSWMQINASTGQISGTPRHPDVGDSYSIIVHVSDGEHEVSAEPFELTVMPLIDLNPEINITANVNGDFYLNQNIVLTFDKEIDVSTISVDAPNGACISNIQVSLDDFSSCIELLPIYPDLIDVDVEVTNEDGEIEIVTTEVMPLVNQLQFTTANLDINKNYKLRVTSYVSEGFEYSLKSDLDLSFYTISGLMITEIGGAGFNNMPWFEVYNASRSEVDLSDYKIRTRAIDIPSCIGNTCSVYATHEFQLSSMSVSPGQYVIIRGNHWEEPYPDTERVTYIGSDTYPYWDSYGYITLIESLTDQIHDSVVFGSWFGKNWEPSSIVLGEWNGNAFSNAPVHNYNSNDIYADSIGRNGGLSDSNSAAEWLVYETNTAGGPNDVADIGDIDEDGIPDYAEYEGTTYGGLDLYSLGARAGIKDIFIELDYMDSADEGVIPREEALNKVVEVFADQDIVVHFDVGNLFSESFNPERFNLGGGNRVAFSQGIAFAPSALDTRANMYDVKRMNMDYARLPIFHYMLMAFSQQADGSQGSGGIAELNGNDAIITLGNWGLNSSDEANLNMLINTQSITIMHELGHNLSLEHGGSEGINYKPNYISVMNYLYALNGLPTVGDNEGDRYYIEKNHREGPSACGSHELTNPPEGDYQSFMIDYSHEHTVLNERSLTEAGGLNMPGSGPVDFNCNGDDTETLLEVDINFSGTTTNLSQTADWAQIELRFQRFLQGNLGVSQPLDRPYDLSLIQDVVGDDTAELIYEEPPSSAFMDRVRSLQ